MNARTVPPAEQRLRIAYILGAFPKASETFIVNQIVGVAGQGHEVDIYTTLASTDPIPESVERLGLMARVHALNVSPTGFRGLGYLAARLVAAGPRALPLLWRVLGVIRRDGASGALRLLNGAATVIGLGKGDYDVIHAQFGPYGLLALNLIDVGALRGPVVTSFRGYDSGNQLMRYPRAYARLFRHGALFLPVCRAVRRRLIDAGCEPAKARVHHSGIRCAQMRFAAKRRGPAEPTRLIVVARLVEKKGIRYAIAAVARVLASGRDVQCDIVGDGPLYAELECYIRECALESHVRLLGWKSHAEVVKLLETAHVLLAPSVTAEDTDEEGIPNSMKEAMALGLPVIATRHGGIPELLEDGASGYLVPERDVDALADRIAAVADDPDVWFDMGTAGRRRVESEYDIDTLTHELVRMYREAALAAAMPVRIATPPLFSEGKTP